MLKEISHSEYIELLVEAIKLNPKVARNVDPNLEHENNTLYFKSNEGISYLTGFGKLGGLARFKNGNEGVAVVHQKHRTLLGGNYLECYDGKLVELYQRSGFNITARVKFDESLAPYGWESDLDLVDRPDIIFMSNLNIVPLREYVSYGIADVYSCHVPLYLVRLYQSQGDKANIGVSSLKRALDIVGRKLENIRSITPVMSSVDLHFLGTDNYIRIVKPIL